MGAAEDAKVRSCSCARASQPREPPLQLAAAADAGEEGHETAERHAARATLRRGIAREREHQVQLGEDRLRPAHGAAPLVRRRDRAERGEEAPAADGAERGGRAAAEAVRARQPPPDERQLQERAERLDAPRDGREVVAEPARGLDRADRAEEGREPQEEEVGEARGARARGERRDRRGRDDGAAPQHRGRGAATLDTRQRQDARAKA